ncbi:GLPGLI family protein, partial [Winogradskyella sp.]|uniref:GLPGLI family protein n=1 Tax=Winogradskyella sp. TaxID=1883156 RepID=UPI003AB81645
MKNLFTLLCICIGLSVTAQNFQGKAIYKTHRKINLKLDGPNGTTLSDENKAQMDAMLMKQFQKTFTLDFNRSESVYKEQKKLGAPEKPTKGMNIMIMGSGGGSDVLYKNTQEKKFINKTEIMGKLFLIKDQLPNYNWELSSETKNIGIYTCYKATYTREIERTTMDVVDGEVKEKTEKVTLVTTAWYTPQIPVSNGPGSYAGLPGLILEINDGKLTIVCAEIVMNPADKIEIKKPTKGKTVSQKQYDEIMAKKNKEMMEKFNSGRKRGKGNSISIEIG